MSLTQICAQTEESVCNADMDILLCITIGLIEYLILLQFLEEDRRVMYRMIKCVSLPASFCVFFQQKYSSSHHSPWKANLCT